MQTSPSIQSVAPSHDLLLTELFETGCNINDLIAVFHLTPAQFLAFAKDPLVIETLDAWEALQERHQRIMARQAQAGAAGHLHQSIMDSPTTIETRRAATALARLAALMQAPPKRHSSPAPGGGGGRVFEAGGGGASDEGGRVPEGEAGGGSAGDEGTRVRERDPAAGPPPSPLSIVTSPAPQRHTMKIRR